MRKMNETKSYNPETSEYLGSYILYEYDDLTIAQHLYRTPDGAYFLHVINNTPLPGYDDDYYSSSLYCYLKTAGIWSMSENEAIHWVKQLLSKEDHIRIFETSKTS